MRYTNISKANFNEKSVFCGFVKEIRNKNNIAFIVLQDITGTIQLTFLKKDHPEFEQLLSRITAESCIFVEGIVKENPSVKLNGKEMVVDKLTIETIATSPLPIDDTSLLDTRLNYR
ncbi:hypothetical protein FACS189459_6590 [Bacilli bacterium]|nr:hypothetical protein FACS189459_6590 [Bacilli bacterium]